MAKNMHGLLPRSFRDIVESLFTYTPLILFQADLVRMTTTYVSPSIERVLGYTAEEVIALEDRWTELIHPEDRDRILLGIRSAIAEKETDRQNEYRLRHASGEYRWFRAMARLGYDSPGVPTFALGLLLDITERVRAEEALRRNEEKLYRAQKLEAVGRLAGGVAHDFNNLLTVVSGYGQLLLRRVDSDPHLERYVNGILGAVQHAARLTDQLLTFSRKQVLQPVVLGLHRVVSEIEILIRRLIGDGIELTIDLADDLGRIKADPSQIEQVIMNLCVNARDAMPGGGRLEIEARNVTVEGDDGECQIDIPPGRYVLLAIRDTGQGIEPELLTHIFDPFFTTKPEGMGTGLGLSTVYGIVKQSGGDLCVQSQPGSGTVVKVFLPLVEEAAEQPVRIDPVVEPRKGSETIFIVEDREDVRNLIREILEIHGYMVLEAMGGESALRAIERHAAEIDLLVTDIFMPHLSGRTVAEYLLSLRPEAKILFVSGYSEEDIFQTDNHLPAAFLQKPFTPRSLAQKVREVLDIGFSSPPAAPA